ncbi:MAG: peptidoglycan DD-metalloendopeptidase family protein, partial [Actinomycetota bacterium]|nr:peptidoglycan DD-metalloendopeptidase family protein [Actinomycetota bacterium]
LPAAHAASGHPPGAATSASPADGSVEQPAVSAAPDAAVAFVRSGVTSSPGPGADPAADLHATGTANAALPPASSGLHPPLTSLTVTSPYGYRVNPLTGAGGELHTGIDFAGSCGTAVFAAGSGTVTEAGWSQNGGGNRIVVDHGGGIRTTYNHLAGIGVSVGQQVGQGARIAGVGTTGNSTGCHLHFEVMVNSQTVNPAPFI